MKKLTKILLLISFLFSSILFTGNIFKVYSTPISPDKYYIDLSSGQVIKNVLTIYGKETLEQTKKVYIYVLGMKKVGEENDREFYAPNPSDSSEVANWINVGMSEADLSPGETIILPWSITKKGEAQCGTNLAAIIVSGVRQFEGESGAIINFKNEVVSQVHVNILETEKSICKDNQPNLNLIEFKLNSFLPFFDKVDIPFVTRIKNEGKLISRSPKGFIEIFGFGEKVTLPFNPEKLDIYPGTVRKFEDVWLDPNYPKDGNLWEQFVYELGHLRIGQYEARLGITKNVGNNQIVESVYFWVLPWRILIPVIILLIIIMFLINRNRRAMNELKKYKSEKKA